ncbi:MAG: methyl-accepting chemotaxis protein, partial [Pararoseburia sp.]|nr:methyl-accepting chemotaxis protein [Lachnospiraceae bacterium]MDY4792635.1 methyl-accepting chemotaxis protein [Pararoseburia sp.]
TQSTAENIQNQTVMTQNIQDSIENTLERSETMVSIAEKSKQLNNDNMTIMEDIKSQSRTISETNANVAETMQALQERANAVKGIADTIFAISSQTNLLALNASIESARAGEAGRGFAVVADEIRQLAEKTRTETENIATILDELSENAERAVGVVAQSVEATNQQDELINKAAESIEAMDTNVNELTSNIEEIDNMLSNLSEANNQIVDSITQLSATTEEVTASSAQAEGISNQNLENADNTKEILDKVLSVSQALDKYVGKTEEPSEV